MKWLMTVLLAAAFLPLYAQNIAVSEDLTLRNEISYEIIGEIKGQVLLFRNRTIEFEVQGFNKDMKLSWSKLIELDKRNAQVIGIVASKSDFTVLYQFRNRSSTVVKAHRYDAGANLLDSTTVRNLGYLFYTPAFQVIRSEDRTKVLIYYTERQNIIKALAFDLTTQKLLWEKAIMPDDFILGQDIHHQVVDNEGNWHTIIERDNFRAKKKQHYYEVLQYYGEDSLQRQFNIPMKGLLTYDVVFTYDNLNHRLVGVGLYGEKDAERASGYFYLNIDPERHADYLLSYEPFDEEFLSNLLGKSAANKGLDETVVREVVLRKDGGALFVAERTKQLLRRSASNRTFYDASGRAIVDYYYDDMFVISIHPTGKTHWRNVLHKKQYSQDDDGVYSSYFLFKTPGSLRFLFNDEIRYENTVSEYVINNLGQSDRKSLLSTQNLELRLRFRDAIQLSANELLVPSERRSRLRLVKMIY